VTRTEGCVEISFSCRCRPSCVREPGGRGEDSILSASDTHSREKPLLITNTLHWDRFYLGQFLKFYNIAVVDLSSYCSTLRSVERPEFGPCFI
jgi:hypothetical protein